jgi:hypothetical protein|tara:strand:- start:1668 stop:2033 length:366 start_codon:yes stop_codon:yes gene_type:complete
MAPALSTHGRRPANYVIGVILALGEVHMVSLAVPHTSPAPASINPSMKTRPIKEIMRIADEGCANSLPPDHPKLGLNPEEQALFQREARLLWRLNKPLESIHGARRRKRGRGWRSPLARGL